MSKGSAHGAFARAIERRQLLNALAAARQLPHLTLADAFLLLVLLADQDSARFDRAAPRWHARLVLAAERLCLADAQLALAAVAALPTAAHADAAPILAALARRHRIPNLERAVLLGTVGTGGTVG